MAMWRSLAILFPLLAGCRRLFGGFFNFCRKRLRAGPSVLRNVKQNPFRPVKFLLEISSLVAAVALIDVMLGAETLEPLRNFVDVLHEDTEVMNAAIIEAL